MTMWQVKQPRWIQEIIGVSSGTIPPSKSLSILIPEDASVDITISGTTITYPLTGASFNVGNSLTFEDSPTISYDVTAGTMLIVRSF